MHIALKIVIKIDYITLGALPYYTHNCWREGHYVLTWALSGYKERERESESHKRIHKNRTKYAFVNNSKLLLWAHYRLPWSVRLNLPTRQGIINVEEGLVKSCEG